jgi:hypothetical protein
MLTGHRAPDGPFPPIRQAESVTGAVTRLTARRAVGRWYVVVGVAVLAAVALGLRDLITSDDGAAGRAAAMVIFGVAALYALSGVAARFVVDPQQLYIDTAFTRSAVPRSRLVEFGSHEQSLVLRLTDGELGLRVDSPIGEFVQYRGRRDNTARQLRTAQRLADMLATAPMRPTLDTDVRHSIRWAPILAGVAIVAASAILTAIALPH